MGIASHSRIHIIGRPRTLVESHVNLLGALLVAVAGTTLLHVGRGVAGYVCVVGQSASELRLVAIASRILTLLIALILSVRRLVIHDLNILIIIIIISFLSLRLESSDRHP